MPTNAGINGCPPPIRGEGDSPNANSRGGGFVLALSLLALAPLANAQSPPAPPAYTAQFGGDAQHTGRTSLRAPRVAPQVHWRFRARHRVYASPVLTRSGLIAFAGVDGMLHALDRDGVERWAYSAPDEVFSSPAVLGDLTLVGHDGGALVALDPRGSVRWRFATTDDLDAPPTIGPDGAVYIATRELVALSPDGTVRWRTPLGSHAFAAPSLSRDGATVYAADLSGELFFVRARDGHIERRIRVAPGTSVYGAPLVTDQDLVVVGARDGHVRAYAPDGAARWDFTTRDEVHATPALGRDGTVVVGSDDGGIYGIRAADGTQAFRVPTSGRVRAHARIDADGTIVVGSEDDSLYALEPSGAVRWTVSLGADIDDAALILPDGSLAVGCDDAALYHLVATP